MSGSFADEHLAIDLAYDILKILAFILFGTAYVLAFSYLKSLSLAKECLLVYLYKDVISSMMLYRTFSAIEVVLDFWNAGGTSKTQAMIISFGHWFGGLYLALTLIFISIYNLYVAKSNTIDPTIDWLGKDEASAIKRIRCGCCLAVIGFLAINFGMELYPYIFYTMIPHHSSEPDMLISNILYRGTLILLLLVSGILITARRIYGSTHNIQIDPVLTKSIKYIFALAVATIGTMTITEYFQFVDIKTSRKIYNILVSPIEMFAPFVIILRSDQLKIHSIRFMKNKFDDAFMLSIYLIPTFMFIVVNLTSYIIYYIVDISCC